MERRAEIRGRGSIFSRRGEVVVLLSLSVAALLLMLLTNSTQVVIARQVEDLVLVPFRGVDRAIAHIRELSVSNREVRAELAAARLELARLAEMQRENERLRAMLGFEGREPLGLIGCEVVAEGAGRLGGSTVLLNRGFNQGLEEGMALVGRDGLVGKVVEVRPSRSHALLLTHPDCAVAARIERNRIAGIVEWLPGSFTGLKLRNISYLADVRTGDQVVSSGLGGVFPEGVPVGTVTEIERDETGLLLDITLKPATDFRAIEEIFALRGGGKSLPADTTRAQAPEGRVSVP
jgi:rod shape-determining protein MreC